MDVSSSLVERKLTRQISVGNVTVGGDAPITVQSMTITKTADVEGTLQQIYALAAAGATSCAAPATRPRRPRGWPRSCRGRRCRSSPTSTTSTRWRWRRWRPACTGLRLNPGNIRKPEHIKAVAAEATDRGIPIRIGVNGGSLDPALYEKYGGATPEAMVESAQQEIAYFDEVGFDMIKISVKASSVPLMVEAYRQLSRGHRPSAAPRRHRGRPAAGRAGQGHGRDRHAAASRASATRSATRSPPIRSRRPAPVASCSRRSGCASARTST